jgi:lysophospholipase L1-like esterase
MSRILNTKQQDLSIGSFALGNTAIAAFNTALTALNTGVVSSGTIDFNYQAYVKSIIVGCSTHTIECRIQVGFNGDTANIGFGDGRILVPKGSSIVIPYDSFVRQGQASVIVARIFDGSMNELTPTVGSPITVSGTFMFTGELIPRDYDQLAPLKTLFIGDSITKAQTGITNIRESWVWQTRNRLRSNGERTNIQVNGHSGSNSLYHLNLQRDGFYDFSNLDKVFILLGTNDAAQSVSSATFISQMTEFIDYFKDTMPNTKIYVLGATPTDNNTWDGFLSQYRTALDTLVNTTINDPNVFYINLGDSFDRTVLANYATSDSVGSKIHLSATGNAAVSLNLWTKYQAL